MPRVLYSRAGPGRWLVTALAALALATGAGAGAQAQDSADERMSRLYAPFQSLLDDFLVSRELPGDGLITAFDYRGALAQPDTAERLERQRARLAEFDPDTLQTREDSVAFWVNAYNYFMIDYLLAHPDGDQPVSSVRDYGSWINPYRVFRRSEFDVGGRRYSLSEIENDILLGDEFERRGWKEARVHFAVNCASVGCPPLLERIYLPSDVDEVLSDNTRRALNTELHLRLEGDTLYLSSLFDWYEADYVAEEGSVRDFVLAYADPPVREKVERATRIRFIDYDWSLNEPSNFPQLQMH